MHSIGDRLYGESYDVSTGVVRAGKERVREGLAEIGAVQLANPHVSFFQEANPGFARGDELLCLSEIRWSEPFRLILRTLSRKLRGRY